jgi:hypothetical protein
VVKNRDVSAIVFNQPGGLQCARGDCDACAPHAGHVREKLLRERQFVRPGSVGAHRKPAREPLFNRVQTVTNRDLCNLRDQQTRVAQEEIVGIRTLSLCRKLRSERLSIKFLINPAHDPQLRRTQSFEPATGQIDFASACGRNLLSLFDS